MTQTSNLPKDLTRLVNLSLNCLGECIQIEYGDKVFNEVESIRSEYKSARSISDIKLFEVHQKVYEQIKALRPQTRLNVAHSFALSLELINTCENAYRSHRLDEMARMNQNQKGPTGKRNKVTFVLTAHPTEARSPAIIDLLNRVTGILSDLLSEDLSDEKALVALKHYILLMLKRPISKIKKPQVQDEAEYIYSILFQEAVFQKQIDLLDREEPVFIRTWVGGDKDGHPGVDDKAMLKSLNLSRKYIIDYIARQLNITYELIESLDHTTPKLDRLKRNIRSLRTHINHIGKIGNSDARKIKRFFSTLQRVTRSYEATVGVVSPELQRVQGVRELYPGLCVPLEIREDSAEIQKALKQPSLAIVGMLKKLKQISNKDNPTWYVRGFVISMCEEVEHMVATQMLLQKYLGSLRIPIIPLYETRSALERSRELTKAFIELKPIQKVVRKHWGSKIEIMLGYSDSAKESGALYSRFMIYSTLRKLDRAISEYDLTPIFFHGSGGSVARGGGSLEEQVSWWPRSARERFKATIQGEMVYRSFSSPQILDRQVSKIRTGTKLAKSQARDSDLDSAIESFALSVSEKYSEKVNDADFLSMVKQATPYPFLEHLKIGSRPSKRKKEFKLSSLRAIPWVLCWTQTRVLFPVWWGIGSTWKDLSETEKRKLIRAYKETDFMSSFVKTLAYSLSKVDMSVWHFYLSQSGLPKEEYEAWINLFKREYSFAKSFVSDISGEKDLTWFRPWLGDSVKLRSTMIYPLNVFEVDALKREDLPLLRESITGVASGMLTTG